ncbi:MAG: hypothetical protein HDS14_06020 [Bacteroides sp.]|nr:hypothetical protein [Bacteroides sp.]
MTPQTISITIPTAWNQLSDSELRDVYALLAANRDLSELTVALLFRWSGIRFIGHSSLDGRPLLRKKNTIFSLSVEEIVDAASRLDFLRTPPQSPLRISAVGRRRAIEADFSARDLRTYIICDNLYQGFLQTRDPALIDRLAEILYPAPKFRIEKFSSGRRLRSDILRINCIYWMIGLKLHLSRLFPDFLKPLQSDNRAIFSPAPTDQRQNMTAMIRALTKGDVTKQEQTLGIDLYTALTELNELAREAAEIEAKYNK